MWTWTVVAEQRCPAYHVRPLVQVPLLSSLIQRFFQPRELRLQVCPKPPPSPHSTRSLAACSRPRPAESHSASRLLIDWFQEITGPRWSFLAKHHIDLFAGCRLLLVIRRPLL